MFHQPFIVCKAPVIPKWILGRLKSLSATVRGVDYWITGFHTLVYPCIHTTAGMHPFRAGARASLRRHAPASLVVRTFRAQHARAQAPPVRQVRGSLPTLAALGLATVFAANAESKADTGPSARRLLAFGGGAPRQTELSPVEPPSKSEHLSIGRCRWLLHGPDARAPLHCMRLQTPLGIRRLQRERVDVESRHGSRRDGTETCVEGLPHRSSGLHRHSSVCPDVERKRILLGLRASCLVCQAAAVEMCGQN
jgi:hypothetical protein